MMSLALDTSASKKIAEAMLATEKQVQKATRRALVTVAKTASTSVKKEVSVATGISQKRLGVRVQTKRESEDEILIWFGANPVDVASLGKIKKNTRSMGAGRIMRRGAFKATLGSVPKIFIREASKNYTQGADGFGDTRYGEGMDKGRFPLRRAVVHIADEVEQAMDDMEIDIQSLFDKRMQAELNYEINVAGGR